MNLALLEDRLEEGTRLPVGPAPRVVYVVSGRVEVESVAFGENEAWCNPDACTIEATMPTRLWRWELRSDEMLKTIIHDWDDARCVRVLGNCRARLPENGRAVCADKILPPMGDTGASGSKLLDMLMMVSLPGKERTEAEWRALYAAAGLAMTSITVVNPRSGESLIEGFQC
jgi:hypothetical protein